MKKRLLSATLALAMVLTMLPLSVMPAFAIEPSNEGADVYYHEKTKDFSSGASTELATAESGWYFWTVITAEGADKGKRDYTGPIDSGFVTSTSTSNGSTAKWYSEMGKVLTVDSKDYTPKPGSFTLLGDVEAALLDWTISDGRLNGKTLTIKAYDAKNQSITVKDELGTDGSVKSGSGLVLPTDALTGYSLKVYATNTAVSGGISVANTLKGDGSVADVKTWGTGDIKLTNCTLGADIDLPKGTVSLDNANGAQKTITIGTCASGQGGTITLDHKSAVKSVTLYGPSTLNVYDLSQGGDVTVFGGGKADVEANAKLTDVAKMTSPNWGSKINLKTSGSVTSIGAASGSRNALKADAVDLGSDDNSDTSTHTINAETRGNAGAITLDYANVTLTGAGATSATVKVGSVKLSGSASIGAITLGDATLKGACTLEIGEGATVTGTASAAAVAVSNLTVKVTGGNIDTLTLPNDYKGGGVTGGSFTTPIEKPAWMSKVTYQITKGGATTYQHTYTDSMEEAISAYTDTAGASSNQNEVAIVGSSSSAREIKFFLDTKDTATGTPAFVLKADPGTLVELPSKLGSRSVLTWYNGSTPYPAGDSFQVATGSGAVELNAISSDADIGTINGVTAKVTTAGATNPNLAAEIVGNTIKLSGAVEMAGKDSAPLELTFTTTTGKSMKINATFFNYNPKEVRFAPGGTTELSVTGNDKEVSLKGSSIRFTVDCSNLKRMESVSSMAAATEQEVTVSGTNLGKSEKDTLIAALKKGITFDYSKSNALNRAVNAALASYTESSIKSAIAAGQREVAKDLFKTNSPTSDQLKNTDVLAYDKLKIQVYLDIRVTDVTNYGPSSNGSITLDITPKYHEVVNNGTKDFVNPAAKSLDANLLKSTDGKVEITIPALDKWGLNIFKTGAKLYAHHGNYVYEVANSKFENLHGFSTFVINTELPVASADLVMRNGAPEGTKGTQAYYYDSLTQAVADVANGGKVTVNNGYKGATSIPVSGSARQFTVDNKANAGTALTFTGANVTSNGKNDTYTVELTQDNFVNTSITVSSNSNGTTTVSTNSARPGATVTITATPKSGYQASTPTVTTNTGASVTVSGSNGTYTFVVPAGATSITVRPNYVLSTGMPFTDVTNTSAWYFNGVKYCWDTMKNGYHLMQGYSDDEFGPSRNFTRAEMVQILYNINGRPSVTGLSNPFSDVNRTNASIAWAYDAIVWAANNGFADGDGDGRFRPSSNVSRCELVEFLWKYETKPTGSGNLNAYSDGSSVPQWAQASMRWAVGFNILSGQNSVSLGNSIAAESNALRSQVAVTMMQYYERYGG